MNGLMEALQKVSQKAYAASGPAEGTDPGASAGGGAPADEDTVEGDFKEV